MKKMNKKAFAVSVLLYGIILLVCFAFVIIISISSTSYKKSRSITNAAKEDLTYQSKIESLEKEIADLKAIVYKPTIVSLGNSTGTFDIKTYTSNYASLTISNFIIGLLNVTVSFNNGSTDKTWHGRSFAASGTYDSTTGILTVTGTSLVTDNSYNVVSTGYPMVYLIY